MWIPDANMDQELSKILTDMSLSLKWFVDAINKRANELKHGKRMINKHVWFFIKATPDGRKNIIRGLMCEP